MENLMAAAAAGPAGQRMEEFVDWINPSPVTAQVMGCVTNITDLIPNVATIAAQYITGQESIGVFGPNFWQSREIDVGAVRPINYAFYDYWYGPDPVDPICRVCNTHHWPVWIPEDLSLATLERAGLRFAPNDTEALRQHKNTHIGGGYYAVMRKEVLGRNLPEAEQIRQLEQAGYLGLAQAAEVAAVIFAINQHDGSLWLGTATGAENRWTYTRCVERVAFDKDRYPLVVGSSVPSGVGVTHYYEYDYEDFGVAAIRRF